MGDAMPDLLANRTPGRTWVVILATAAVITWQAAFDGAEVKEPWMRYTPLFFMDTVYVFLRAWFRWGGERVYRVWDFLQNVINLKRFVQAAYLLLDKLFQLMLVPYQFVYGLVFTGENDAWWTLTVGAAITLCVLAAADVGIRKATNNTQSVAGMLSRFNTLMYKASDWVAAWWLSILSIAELTGLDVFGKSLYSVTVQLVMLALLPLGPVIRMFRFFRDHAAKYPVVLTTAGLTALALFVWWIRL